MIVDSENNSQILPTTINQTTNSTSTICPHIQEQQPNIIHLVVVDDECHLQQIHLSENLDRSAPSSRQDSTDGHLYSCSTMTTPSQENLLECTGGSCDPLFGSQSDQHSLAESTMMEDHLGQSHHLNSLVNELADDENDIGDGGDGSGSQHTMEQTDEHDHQSAEDECDWNNENLQGYDQSSYEQSDYDQQANYEHTDYDQLTYDQSTNSYDQASPNEINEYIDNKSSKEMYKAAAKKWGITCKMSDQCRCMECQSHYFDCEYEDVSIKKNVENQTFYHRIKLNLNFSVE